MNTRLKELAEWRAEQHVTPLPPAEPLAPQITQTETPKMSITGLQAGAFEAKLAQIKKTIADKQSQGLAKIDTTVAAEAAKLEAAVDGVTAKISKEVDDQLAEFAAYTNGGPA